MNGKERYEIAAQVIEGLAGKGFSMMDFAQLVRELGEREELAGEDGVFVPNDNLTLEQRVTHIIHELGIPASIHGYHYVRCAICKAVVEFPKLSVVSEIYLVVAKKFDTTETRVERSIRNAIEVAWMRGNPEVLQEYFGYTVSESKGRPTNGEFISMIA